jgi:hypothetical protein
MPYLAQYSIADEATVRRAGFLGLALGQVDKTWLVGLVFRDAVLARKIAEDIFATFEGGEDRHDEFKLRFKHRADDSYEFSCYYRPKDVMGLSKALILEQSPPEPGPDQTYLSMRSSYRQGDPFCFGVAAYDPATAKLDVIADRLVFKRHLHFVD